jgi:hypothetical protein
LRQRIAGRIKPATARDLRSFLFCQNVVCFGGDINSATQFPNLVLLVSNVTSSCFSHLFAKTSDCCTLPTKVHLHTQIILKASSNIISKLAAPSQHSRGIGRKHRHFLRHKVRITNKHPLHALALHYIGDERSNVKA